MIPNRQELEDEWRRRVAEAKLELDMARAYLVEVQRDLKNGLVSSSDGDYAYQHALRAETRALGRYRDVLAILSDLMAHGKIPPPDRPG